MDRLSPLQPHIHHGAVDQLQIPAPAAGCIHGPTEQIIELKGAKPGEGRALLRTALLEIEKLQRI